MGVSLGIACVAFMTDTVTSLAWIAPDPPSLERQNSFWSRIAQQLEDAIGRGIYTPGERLPSEHALAEQFGVNRHTVRRSLASLCQRGLVRSTRGRGTFVETFAVDMVLGKRTRHRQSLAHAGVQGALRVLASAKVQANVDQARALGVVAGSALLHLQVLGQGANQPLHFSDRYFPLPRFDRLADLVVKTGSITEAFGQHGVQDYVRQESRISARLPDRQVAALLQQPHNHPALFVTSVNVDLLGLPIELAMAWFAGDRVTLTVNHHEN